jgi:hypothetical protein
MVAPRYAKSGGADCPANLSGRLNDLASNLRL